MLPLHEAVSMFVIPLAKTVIKAHILTGNNYMSKIRNKHAAVASDPEQYLMEAATLSQQDEALAEKYLFRVWADVKSSTTKDTFDQLRIEVRGHVRCADFVVHWACGLLSTTNQPASKHESTEHGCEDYIGTFVPSKYLNLLPKSLLTTCNCAGYCKTRLRC